MNVLFSPNPYSSEVTIGGAAIPSDDPEGKEFYFKTERTNYYISSPTLPPTYEIKYGSGWSPKEGEVRGTFTGEGYGRIAAYIDYSNTMTALEYDGSNNWAIYLDGGIIGIKNGNFENVTYGKWDGEKVIKTYNQDGTSTTTTDHVTDLRFGDTGCWPGAAMDNMAPRCDGRIDTNIPLFLTQAEAQEYCRTGDTTGILNGDVPVEPNVYDYYLYNRISTTVGAGWDIENLFRYKMNTGKRLAFYMHSDFGLDEYDRVLVGSSEIAQSYKGDYYGQDPFPDSNEIAMRALGEQRKMQSGTTYTPVMYETNIPTFDTLAHAQNYIDTGDETGILDKWRTEEIVPGEIGDPADQTPQGENGMVYTYGSRMYRLSNLQLFHFYDEVFDPTPATVQAILDGLQLFGANQINAIQDVMYLPFDVDDVATMSAATNIKLGTYTMQAQGEPIQKNDKLIDMGTVYFPAPYGARDFRNYEPNCKLYIMLPYAGTHELQISKYIGKNVTLKMACDVSTGQATYFLYAGGCIMDSFDCIVGVHRPITAVDHAQHTAMAMNAIMQTGQSAIGTLAQGVSGGVKAAGSAASAGLSAGAIGAGAISAGVASGAGGAINTIMSGYQAMNIYNDAPMTPRGSFTGGTGLFDVKSPYFIFAQLKPQMASNLAAVMGRPSSAGGLVSSFSGFLQTCAFSLADGFTGTEEEAAEIYSLMEGGVYVD